MATPHPLPYLAPELPQKRPIIDVGLAIFWLLMALGFTLVLFVVVPRFEDIFKDFGAKLPVLTIGIFRISRRLTASVNLESTLGWLLIWTLAFVPPFVATLLAGRTKANAPRRALRISWILSLLVLLLLATWLFLALFMPMISLLHSISDAPRKGGQ